MNLGISWTNFYQTLKDIYGRDLDEATMIRRTNLILDDLRMKVNLPSQIRTDYIPYVYEFERYKLPDDYKTEGKISLRYDDQIDNDRNRTYLSDEPPFQRYNKHWRFYTPEVWNERINLDQATINFNKGKEKLWLSNGRSNSEYQEISACDSLTGWTAGGGAGSLALDEDVKAEGNYSINFDLTAATAATLTYVIPTAVDLTEYINAGLIRLFKWLPTAPSSIEIQIGDDSSNYYTQTITTQADGDIFDTENLNEIEFSFRDATKSGSPTMSSVLHFKIILNFSSATTDTDFRIDSIRAYKPENLVFEYYSYYFVKTSAGVWQKDITETVGTDEEILILPEWRRVFAKLCLLDELEKSGDSRYVNFYTETDKWLKEISKRYPNRAKREGSFYW
ncbi:MAG: hypothetical protein WC549_04700 [Actinomycetota bacterium]